MSLHYILDGYNILHKIPFPPSLTLEAQRDCLARLLEERRPQGSVNNQVTVVFDGQPGHFGIAGGRMVRVIFSEGESADEKIKKMVAEESSRGHIVVVTDDRGIRAAVRADGAKVLGVMEFMEKARSVSFGVSPPPGARISAAARAKIDEEFRKRWLGE